MNKKLLLGAALLVGMGTTFTSCVDSTESASVIKIREAKAEQLKALADMQKAQGEAAVIMANAEQAAQQAAQDLATAQALLLKAQAEALAADADYKAAEAELLRAQAEYEKARQRALDAQTEAEKDRLAKELALKDAELQKALADAKAKELANEKAQMELDNLQAQYDQQKAEAEARLKQLEAAIAQQEIYNQQQIISLRQMEYRLNKEMKDDANKEAAAIALAIKNRMEEYETALRNLNSAKLTVARDKKILYAAQAGLINAQQGVEENIAGYYDDIAEQNRIKDEAQKVIDAFSKFAGTHVTEADVTEAYTDWKAAEAAQEAAETAAEAAQDAFDTAKEDLEGQPNTYKQLVDQTLDNSYGYWIYDKKANKSEQYSFYITDYSETNTSVPTNCRGKYALYVMHRVYDYREVTYTTPEWDSEKGEWVDVEYKYWSNVQQIEPTSYIYTPVYEDKEWALNVVEVDGVQIPYFQYDTYLNLIDNGKGLKDWQTHRLDAIKYNTTDNLAELKANLEEAKTAQAQAKTAYENNFKANETAKAELKTAKQELETAEAERAKLPADATAEQIQAADNKVTAANTKVGEKETAANTASTNLSASKSALNSANDDVTNWNRQIISMENALADQANKTEEVNKLVADIFAEAANNDALIAAYNSAAEEKAVKDNDVVDAKKALETAEGIYKEVELAYNDEGLFGGEETNSMWNKYFNEKVLDAERKITNADNTIKQKEESIKAAEETLENLKSDNPTYNVYDPNSGVMVPYKNFVEAQEAIIANDELAVQVAEQRCEIAKAALESALKQQETPAE
ncbi:MAG: hypothetical protein K2K98_10575 [Muribaculaceae bacterium]|nr:hypothetical protein [Muribaculaceae bacterium]